MKISTGIEGTYAPHNGNDTLAATRHYERAQWRRDLSLIRRMGIEEFRYPIPWHRIEAREGRYDWRHMDDLVAVADRYGLSIIADPLHHTSYPSWLHGGFASPRFAREYVRFVTACARRYPQITSYTPFNEPTCTLDFSGHRGFWHPYHTGDRSYVKMLRNTARATAEVIHVLLAQNSNVRIVHIDTFERHAALDDASVARAEFLNERRFLFEELIRGKVHRDHRLVAYLRRNGFAQRDLDWHVEHPARIDVRGGDYYPLCEEQLLRGVTHHAPSRDPVGLAAIAVEYAQRIDVPLSLTETNIQGTVRDRISWLKYTLEQVETLEQRGVRLQSFSWYPLFDCAGWHCLLQQKKWKRDPQGIVSCDDGWRRVPTELTDHYASIVRGVRSSDLPGYSFTQSQSEKLAPLTRQMKWRWQEQ